MFFNSSEDLAPLGYYWDRGLAFQINFMKNHRKKTRENNMQAIPIACQGNDEIFLIAL
jgi:hypothetical protein